MKIQLLFMFSVLLMISCGGNRNIGAKAEDVIDPVEETDFFVFDLEKGISEGPRAATLNELIDTISYIPLETHEKALLPAYRYNFAKIGGDMFIDGSVMMLKSSPIYQFDSLGQFVKQITHHGRGPNEVVGAVQWYANANLREINVVDIAYKMVIVETDSGGKSTVNFNSSQGLDKVPLNDSTFVSAQDLNYRDLPNTYLYFTDRNGNLVHSIERNDELLSYNTNTSESGQAPPYETYRLWPNYKGDAIFKDIFNDTLYRVKSYKEITPHLVFTRGALSSRPEDKQKPERKKNQVFFGRVLESGDHVFLNYFHEEKRWSTLWSKCDGSLVTRTIPTKGSVFDISVPFALPDGTLIDLQVVYADHENIYCVMEALDACKFLPGVKEDDNPVIVVAKLRK